MLTSKVDSTGNGGETSGSAGFGPSNSSQVAETSIPNFLLKLWKLVEDNRYNQCIEWDPTGFSFHVREPYGFSKDVLPLYFKHSNLNSFIRQLNMYGFRKVTNLEKGALKQQMDQDSVEFQHPYFVRGHPELLQYIKRKISNPRTGAELDVQQHSSNARGLNQVLEELRQLRDKQFGMDARLNHVKKENGTLWREVAHMRQLHMKQQQVVNKLIQFLLSLVQPAAGKRLGKRQLLAIGPGLLAEQYQQDHDEQPAKRLRSDSSPSSAANIIESLEQELQNSGRLSFLSPASTRTSVSGGPIIADVTDEPEHYDVVEQRQTDGGPTVACGMQPPIATGMAPAQTAIGYPPVVTGVDGNSVKDFMLQASAPAQNLSFGGISPSGLGSYKEGDSYGSLNAPAASTASQSKSVSPRVSHQAQSQQQAVVQQQAPQAPRPLLNRSISECNAAAPSTDWQPTLRGNQSAEGDQTRWSKPDFSEYLDFVQTDLDSLRDFLASGSLSVDNDSLSNLFTMADESNTLASNSPQPVPTEIVGNEVQLYKRPEILVNFDGAVRHEGGYIPPVTISLSTSATDTGSMTTLGSMQVPPSSAVARPAPQMAPPMLMPHHMSPHQQAARSVAEPIIPTRPDQVSMSSGLSTQIVSPDSNAVANQPVFVLSPTVPLQQGAMLGVPPISSQVAQASGDGRDSSRAATISSQRKSLNRR